MTNEEIEKLIKKTEWWFGYKKFYDQIASHKDFVKFIELGVWTGNSIAYLANLVKDRANLKIYGVDMFENSNYINVKGISKEEIINMYEIYNYNLRKKGVRRWIKDIKGCSWEVADRFENEHFDFIFIDADHSYEALIKDIRAWYPKIKEHGILAGHDWEWASVQKAVNEFFKKDYLEFYKTGIKNLNSCWYVDLTKFNKQKICK